MPLTGQHIALYSQKSLTVIAKKFNLNFYEVSNDLFLFTKKQIEIKKLQKIQRNKWVRILYNRYSKKKMSSLLQTDFQNILNS